MQGAGGVAGTRCIAEIAFPGVFGRLANGPFDNWRAIRTNCRCHVRPALEEADLRPAEHATSQYCKHAVVSRTAGLPQWWSSCVADVLQANGGVRKKTPNAKAHNSDSRTTGLRSNCGELQGPHCNKFRVQICRCAAGRWLNVLGSNAQTMRLAYGVRF